MPLIILRGKKFYQNHRCDICQQFKNVNVKNRHDWTRIDDVLIDILQLAIDRLDVGDVGPIVLMNCSIVNSPSFS